MKQFSISSDILMPALKKLGQAVNPNPTQPILKNVLCRIAKDQVELITTDNILTISIKCVAETEGEFEVLLPYKLLFGFTGFVKSAPIRVMHPSARRATIVGDIDQRELASLDKVEDFAKLPGVPKAKPIKLNDSFVGILANAMHTVGHDEQRPAMTYSCLDLTDDGVFLVSTDSHTMFKYRIECEANGVAQILISPSLAKTLQGLKEIEVSWSQKKIMFRSGDVTVWCTMFDGKFPAYNAVIRNLPGNLKVNRDSMIDALDRCCLDSGDMKQTVIDLKSVSGKIVLKTENPENGAKGSVTIDAEYSGDCGEVMINAKKLITILNQVDTETISLAIKTASSPVEIKSDEDTNYTGLIVPLTQNN